MVSVLAACAAASGAPGSAYGNDPTVAPAATLRVGTAAPPAAATALQTRADSVLTQPTPSALSVALARALFVRAPVVVVAADASQALRAAGVDARAAHAPLLIASPGTATVPGLAASVSALHAVAVLAEDLPSAERMELAARLPGVKMVTSAKALPVTGSAVLLSHVAVLVQGKSSAAVEAASATAQAAGAVVVDVTGTDPRADPAAVTALARLRPSAVIAVGAGFGPAARLASRVAVAETGQQLPGGGQVMFPGRRLVALYGNPGTPALGVLGQQSLAASIDRARRMAAPYRPLSGVPVVPAFEIIASVAEASPGPDGSYSYETPVSELLPWVHAATADGLYVVLDLQPGRANLLTQAEHYQSLLELPDVGLALDAEWKLQPGQVPLRQIGHVDIAEVNSVVDWLAALTASHHLPQKLLVLHQFQLAMLQGEQDLDSGNDDLSIVIHMDGQGAPRVKQGTWDAVTAAAPAGVFFGWKNFLVKDHPMLSPGRTMIEKPAPVMISYQ